LVLTETCLALDLHSVMQVFP